MLPWALGGFHHGDFYPSLILGRSGGLFSRWTSIVACSVQVFVHKVDEADPLFVSLCPPHSSMLPNHDQRIYDEIAPKIEYRIECVLTEQFATTANDLVYSVSPVALWEWSWFPLRNISRFVKEFCDVSLSPTRSEQARVILSIVGQVVSSRPSVVRNSFGGEC